jgi:acetone carboxylase gamma subunit
MSRLISATLELINGKTCCKRCHHAIASNTEEWKPRVALREMPVDNGGKSAVAGFQVVLREFSCPKCGTLLDVETAMKGDEFLNDTLAP